MMEYRKYRPDPLLEHLVVCYYVWEGSVDKPYRIESPPNGCGALVINYGDHYQLYNRKHKGDTVPLTFISGQSIKNYTLHVSGKIGMVGAVLRPASLHILFKMDMRNLNDERIPLNDVDPLGYAQLFKNILQSKSDTEKIFFLEAYIKKQYLTCMDKKNKVIDAANEIYKTKGQISISELISDIPMSRRNFERRFSEAVGVSPKLYARIRRFGYTCLQMAGKREANLMDTLFEAGYYDQSHFIKDFKYFSGRTPKKYVHTNNELAYFVGQIKLVEEHLSRTKIM